MPTEATRAKELAGLIDVATKLVNKLHDVHADERYKSVWFINQLHSGPYEGPTYADELKALESTLEALRVET